MYTKTAGVIAEAVCLKKKSSFGQQDEALAELKKKGFKTAWLTVYHRNERALKFYKKNNFKKIGITYFEMGGNQYENKVMMIDIK